MRSSAFSAFVLAVALSGATAGHARLTASASAREDGPVAPAPQEKNQVFRASVEMVSLNVTVVDSQGHYVTDLAQEEFGVFEDGAK